MQMGLQQNLATWAVLLGLLQLLHLTCLQTNVLVCRSWGMGFLLYNEGKNQNQMSTLLYKKP